MQHIDWKAAVPENAFGRYLMYQFIPEKHSCEYMWQIWPKQQTGQYTLVRSIPVPSFVKAILIEHYCTGTQYDQTGTSGIVLRLGLESHDNTCRRWMMFPNSTADSLPLSSGSYPNLGRYEFINNELKFFINVLERNYSDQVRFGMFVATFLV